MSEADYLKEKCIVVDYIPGACGNFIAQLLFGVCHLDIKKELVVNETGSCHTIYSTSLSLPQFLYFNHSEGCIGENGCVYTVPGRIKLNLEYNLKQMLSQMQIPNPSCITNIEELGYWKERTDKLNITYEDNIIRTHSYGKIHYVKEVLQNSKHVIVTLKDNKECLISYTLFVMKHAIAMQLTGKIGFGHNSRCPYFDNISISQKRILYKDHENFKEYLNTKATNDELLYVGYQLLQIFKNDLDDNTNRNIPVYGWKDDMVEFKFEWILTGNYKEIIKCFEKSVCYKFSADQQDYVKNELDKYLELQNKMILDDPESYILTLKDNYDRLEAQYNQTEM